MKTILVSAYACEPNVGSEPGVGWNWSLELSESNKVIIITRSNNKKAIDSYCANNNVKMSFYYCDIPKCISFWKKGQRGLYLYYVFWQLYSYKLAKKLCKSEKVDYAISLTFGNMWLPTFMHKLPCNFIWGPLGGGEAVPKILCKRLNLKQRVFEKIRFINKIFPLTNPWFYGICKKSDIIIVRTKDSLECIPDKYKNKCITIIETGISEEDITYFAKIREEMITTDYENDFVISGKMVPFKLMPLALEAFAKATEKCSQSKLHILGNGPEKKKLQKMIEQHNLLNHVIMHGNISREESLKIMASCKALLITSAREGGSWVMFEAMMLEKPIICFETSGMAVVVTNKTGILIPVCSYEEGIIRFADAIKIIRNNTELAVSCGKNGYNRAISQFMWKNKCEILQKKIQ